MSNPLSSAPDTSEEAKIAQECLVQAAVVDWFSQLFIAPPDRKLLEDCRSERVLDFLTSFGESLDAVDLTTLIADYFRNQAIEDLDQVLSHQYFELFDGAAGPNAVPPYESYYEDANGRLFQQPYVNMMEILKELDVSVTNSCKEPADHLALELAALAEALRQRKSATIDQLLQRLLGWISQLSDSVNVVAKATLYANLLELLIIYLSSFQNPLIAGKTVKH